MKNKIVFTNTSSLDISLPRPAVQDIPEWYKKHKTYTSNPKEYSENTAATIKKCIPIFDAMSCGYIIYTPIDIWVTREDGVLFFNWKSKVFTPIEFQAAEQTEGYFSLKNKKHEDIPKIINPWSIKTSFGHSCLFLPVMHRESIIKAFPAIVDTDTYISPVNFPFEMFNSDFTGLIPAGTPVVQVIPFKRLDWNMEEGFDQSSVSKQTNLVASYFYNAYRNLFWNRKSYK